MTLQTIWWSSSSPLLHLWLRKQSRSADYPVKKCWIGRWRNWRWRSVIPTSGACIESLTILTPAVLWTRWCREKERVGCCKRGHGAERDIARAGCEAWKLQVSIPHTAGTCCIATGLPQENARFISFRLTSHAWNFPLNLLSESILLSI